METKELKRIRKVVKRYINKRIAKQLEKQAWKQGSFDFSVDGIPLKITHWGIYYVSDEWCDCPCHTNTSNNLPCGSCILSCDYGKIIYPIL